jgi:hypothetical protein
MKESEQEEEKEGERRKKEGGDKRVEGWGGGERTVHHLGKCAKVRMLEGKRNKEEVEVLRSFFYSLLYFLLPHFFIRFPGKCAL